MKLNYSLSVILLGYLAIFLSSCATVNVGNISDETSFSPQDDEKRIWNRCEEIREIIEKSGFIYDDKELTAYLSGIANELLSEEVKQQGFKVKVIVLRDAAFNASMFPNGMICVHTGLLANMDNEAQAAIILAHEMTHFTNRHTLKQFRSMINKSAFFGTLSAVSAVASGYHDYGALADIFLETAFLSSATGFSREHEYEADTGGFKMFAKKYAIDEAPRAFENLKRAIEEEDIKVPYFFSTHPSVQARINNFNKLRAADKEENINTAKLINKNEYDEKIRPLLLDNAELDIRTGRFKSAERALNRSLGLFANHPRAYYLLGEMFRQRNKEQDEEKAIAHYKKAIDVDSRFAPAHKALGLSYYKDKAYSSARKEFEKYLSLEPNAKDSGYIIKYLEELKKENGCKE